VHILPAGLLIGSKYKAQQFKKNTDLNKYTVSQNKQPINNNNLLKY